MHGTGAFPATRHSIVAAMQSGAAEERERALDLLAEAYWQPVYRYLRLRWNKPHDEACDLTQDFFVELVEKNLIARFDAARARLRTYLRLCVDGLVKNTVKAAARQKRGGGATLLSFDFEGARIDLEAATPSAEPSPEEYFEREWVRSVLSLALERLCATYRAEGKDDALALFELYDLGTETQRPTYAELAQRFGIKPTDVTNRLAAVRRAFRSVALDAVREMTASEAEFRAEARTLFGSEPR